MALLKKPYEISVWQDKIKYVGKGSNNQTIETFNVSDLTSVEYQYYTEQRLATIGSHTMTSPTRALEPTLTRNINGTETLKFEMYYQYIDPNTGERVHNPIIDYLVNERKIKLYLDDYDPNHPDKWYDFIIKKDEEKARDNKYSFTCNSLAAHELGKTGFKIELDTELENNMGTVQELGEKVLENSDWQLSTEGQDIIKQTVNEPLYQIYLNQDKTAYYTQKPERTKTISAGEKIYVYYTPYVNKEKDYFQFIYIVNENQIELQSDRMTLICDDKNINDLYLTDVQWTNDKPNFEAITYVQVTITEDEFNSHKTDYYYKDNEEYIQCTEQSVYDSNKTYYIYGNKSVANYRGDRYVRKQKTAYDATLKKTVNIYTDNNARTVYGYQTVKYYGVDAVQNYIHNSVNFGSSSYWFGYGDGSSVERIIYPPASDGLADRTNYLSVKIGGPLHIIAEIDEDTFNANKTKYYTYDDETEEYIQCTNESTFDSNETYYEIDYVNSPRLMNDGIIYNYSKINSFNQNDIYLLRMKVKKKTVNEGLSGYLSASDLPFTCQIRKYTKVDQNTGERCFNFVADNAIDDPSNLNFILIQARCEKSASVEELKNNIGIFFFRSSHYDKNLGENESYYIEEVQLTQGIWQPEADGISAHWLQIDEVPVVKSAVVNYYYYPSANADKTSADDYVYISQNTNLIFTPYYGDDVEHQFEKVRSITAKESNRFNLLQQLCETFECWVKFNITHETGKNPGELAGRIKVEDYDYYRILQPAIASELSNLTFENGNIDTDTGKENKNQENYRLRSDNYIRVIPNTIYRITSNFDKYKILYYTGGSAQNYTGWFTIRQSGQLFRIPNNVEVNYIRILFYNNVKQIVTPSNLNYTAYIIPNSALKCNNLTNEYEEITNDDIQKDEPNKFYYESVTRKRQDKKVVFYGEILEDNPVGFKYGINLKDVTRTLDSDQIATKIIVKDNTNECANNGFCSISRAQSNPTKENFLYNFDYYVKQGILDQSSLYNDLYLKNVAGSIGLYPTLSELNSERNRIISIYTELANDIMKTKSDVEEQTLIYNSATENLAKLTDPISGKLFNWTGYIYEDFDDQLDRSVRATDTNNKINTYNNQIYYAPGGLNNIDIDVYNTSGDWLSVTYYEQINFNSLSRYTGAQIKTNNPGDVSGDHFKGSSALKYCSVLADQSYKRCESNEKINDEGYYLFLNKINDICYIKDKSFSENKTTVFSNNGKTYYLRYNFNDSNLDKSKCDYFQTSVNAYKIKLSASGSPASKVYIYGAYADIGVASPDDTTTNTTTINYLEQISTLRKDKKESEEKLEYYESVLESEQEEYDNYTAQLNNIARATEEIEKEFLIKYSRYVQEGSWTDDNYMDDELYYLDAVQVLYQSAYPKVSYTISVLELSMLEDYEPYKFQVAHKTFIEDTEFFGWEDKARRIPARERIVVTELTTNLDQPDKNSIKVQNYRNHFEDLFQRITAATQNLEYHSGDYSRAADAISTNGEISQTVMEKTMATAQFIIQNANNQSVVISDTGLEATNTTDPAQQVRLTSGGLLVSSDAGRTWGVAITGRGISTSYLRAGSIDTDKITIYSGEYPTFKWDGGSIRALAYTLDTQNQINSYNTSNYVTFDRFGLYGINGILNFNPRNATEVEKKASFALTWDGLFVRSNYRNGYVSISPTDDITLYSYGNDSFNAIGLASSLDNIYYLDNRSVFYYSEDNEYIKCTTESLDSLGDKELWVVGYKIAEEQSAIVGNYYLYGGQFIPCVGDEPADLTRNKFYQINNTGTIGTTAMRRAKFGMIGRDTSGNELYGLALYDTTGKSTVSTQSDGTLWLQDSMRIGKVGQTNTIYIGVGETDNTLSTRYKVINVNDLNNQEKFVVYSDGVLKATGVTIEGTIDATTGTIGGNTIDENGITINAGYFKILDGNGQNALTFDEDNNLTINGVINAIDGEFTGTITAKDGTVGGFNITENKIFSDNLILESAHDDVPSNIQIDNITLGTGANIAEYLNIGNLSLINPEGSNSSVLELKDSSDSDNPYFKLTNNGNIFGKNWNIITDNNNQTIATFDNGVFRGHIEANSGVFHGLIEASTIEAGTIKTTNFITQKIRSMGGAFIFKPSYEIKNKETFDEEDNGNTVTKIKIWLNNINDYSQFEKDDIVSFSNGENGILYGKVDDLSIQVNYYVAENLNKITFDKDKTRYYYKEDDEYIQCTEQSEFQNNITYYTKEIIVLYMIIIPYFNPNAADINFNPTTITWFGKNTTDVIIGINSDSSSGNSFLKPKSLTIQDFNIQKDNNNQLNIDSNVKLLLGDLTGVPNENYQGYGLYADNVYLHGSLITGVGTALNKTYAGINTIPEIESGHFTDEKIVFWAGAQNDEDIENSPFYVTNKGSIYASQGTFEGSVISDSLLVRSTIQTAIIEGIGNSPSLKIYDTGNGGISFYKKVDNIDNDTNNETSDIETLRISNDGIYCNSYQNVENPIIGFSEEDNKIVFRPTKIEIDSTEITNQLIKDVNELKLQIGEKSYTLLDNNKIENKSNNINNITNLLSYELINGTGANSSKLIYRSKDNYYCLFVE